MGSVAPRALNSIWHHTFYLNGYVWQEDLVNGDVLSEKVIGFYKCKGEDLHKYILVVTESYIITLHYNTKSSITSQIKEADGTLIRYQTKYRVRFNYRLIDLFRLCEWIVRNKTFRYTTFNCRHFIRFVRKQVCNC